MALGIFDGVSFHAFSMISPWVLRQAINALQEGVIQKSWSLRHHNNCRHHYPGIFLFYMRQTMIVASRMIEYDLRNDLFAQILKLDRPISIRLHRRTDGPHD
jgi:ATP-binding cassette subfamily B protein